MLNQPTMSRRRPHGKPMGRYGIARTAVPICNVTMRDVSDAYVRAVCLCSDDLDLANEARNGENARLNSLMISGKQVDPSAVGAALLEEIEKLMGIYPNLSGVDPEPVPQRRATDRLRAAGVEVPENQLERIPYPNATVTEQYNGWEEREKIQAKARRIGVYFPDKPTLLERFVRWFG